MAGGFAALLRGRIGKELSFSGYQFERANTEEDRIAAYRFRHRVFLEEGFIDPGDFEDELFTDQFDETSEHILVYSEDQHWPSPRVMPLVSRQHGLLENWKSAEALSVADESSTNGGCAAISRFTRRGT